MCICLFLHLPPPPNTSNTYKQTNNNNNNQQQTGKAIHAAVGRIALVMCISCASAGIVQTLVSGLVQIYKRDETFNSNEIANVVLGALVAVTGCCPFIDPPFAVLIGGRFLFGTLFVAYFTTIISLLYSSSSNFCTNRVWHAPELPRHL